jgi:hypothetical protein
VIFQGFARRIIFVAAAAPPLQSSDRDRARRPPSPTVGSGRENAGTAARRIPDIVGSRLPRPYHSRARIQSFQAVAAPFPGDSVLPSGPLAPRPRRAKRRAFGRPVEPARAKSRFLPHFVGFQGFARRKISHPLATPISCSARSARLRRERRCLRPSRAPTLFRLATCGRARAVARSSSPRSERCPRFPSAVSATREVNQGSMQRP